MKATRPDWDAMAERLEMLETDVRRLRARDRWLKRLAAAALCLTAAVAAAGQARVGRADDPGKKVVEADEFLVKESGGKTRATLNSSGLILHDEAGDARVGLFNAKDGSRGLLLFAGSDQKQQLSVLRTRDGLMAFGINDPNGKTRIMLSTDPGGKPTFRIQDESGAPILSQP